MSIGADAGAARGTRESGGRRLELREAALALLEIEEPLLAPQAAAVADEGAVLADHPMARDDDGDPVHAVRAPDRAHRLRRSDAARDRVVGAHLAVRDLQQLLPDALLERRPGGVQRRLEDAALAAEVLPQLSFQTGEMRVISRDESA